MTDKFNTTILVAPLDWGLGHASRCIPLIRYLSDKGCRVLIASEGMQKKVLQLEFPNLDFVNLDGYNIRYTKNKRWFSLKIMWQLPKILNAIRKEQKWLCSLLKTHNIDAIVSDNRYGLWNRSVPSFFITHQLLIKAPVIFERFIQKCLYVYINRFSACWIPDTQATPNLAGRLSHPLKFPAVPVHYMGGLSRFELKEDVEKRYDLLVVISGPEPQRSMLETRLFNGLERVKLKALFVRGLPGSTAQINSFENVTIVNHLGAKELNLAFQQSDYVISRSGYTTVMDIIKLKRKSILIPTPGQTEQEYLAIHLKKQKWCFSVPQHLFTLEQALVEAREFDYEIPDFSMTEYQSVLNELLDSIGDGKIPSTTFAGTN